jgi:hypothetical protein
MIKLLRAFTADTRVWRLSFMNSDKHAGSTHPTRQFSSSSCFSRRISVGKRGITQATYFNWKRKYDGPALRQISATSIPPEVFVSKLKKLVAGSLDREMLQDVIRRKL